jgi:hypothetical protein
VNVFILDENPALAARYHMDVHVVKMVLESAQLLSTCFLHFDIVGDKSKVYKPTHLNHPCSVWLRESFSNVVWLYQLLKELLYEYTYRFGRIHACSRLVPYFSRCLTKLSKQQLDTGLSPFAQAMPDEYRNECPVVAYRTYYLEKKVYMKRAGWNKNRPAPEWVSTCQTIV